MTRRNGMTLVEVLVAIFVMGIGMLALLTLFPIGMLRMAQAIRDVRCAESAHMAHSISIIQNVRNDPSVVTDSSSAYQTPDAFVNPWPASVPPLPAADPYGKSYPVLVDPIGYYNVPTNSAVQDWVGGLTPAFGGSLRRRPVAFVAGATAAARNLNIFRSFTLPDDLNFDGVTVPGAPLSIVPGAVLRDTRFSWAYLLRRPMTSDRSVVDCSIIVFDQRSLSLSANLTLAEAVYPGASPGTTYFNTANNTITIDYTSSAAPPAVVPGNWILDATRTTNGVTGSAHAYFYRVVAAEDVVVGVNKFARYELQQPIRGFGPNSPSAIDPTNGLLSPTGTVIVMDGIAEVFEKGPVRMP